ncbi:hypothetical protein [Xylella fastidiosa]|nr:hypothetical protein [Xylella fastidiosa]MDG5822181.1 hypothetical protein [Xylella fastidiosa subsp. pauca]WGZ31483.1 hypothetical protein O4444_08135 [Xylella fastidiosa subsp. pauca]WGZ36060.1 hypothetical protein O4443_08675 [Xylella fastidiosa subsp. pauca]
MKAQQPQSKLQSLSIQRINLTMLRFATAGFLYVLLTPIVEASTPHYSVNNPFNQSAPTTVVTPLNKMFYNPPKTPLGIPGKVLSQPYNGEYLMDPMLLHLRVNSRQSIAKTKTTSTENTANSNNKTETDYKKQTIYDNTPWRFNMNQQGKRMTADEFDAWMKARGVHVIPSQTNNNVQSVSEAK